MTDRASIETQSRPITRCNRAHRMQSRQEGKRVSWDEMNWPLSNVGGDSVQHAMVLAMKS